MKVEQLLDTIQQRLGMMKGSVGWETQRPIVMGMVDTTAALLDDDFRDRLRYVPNIMLCPAQVGKYDDAETVTSYKVPSDCDPFYIDALSVQWSGVWYPLTRGINQSMRDDAYQATTTYYAWDIMECGEIEVLPHPVEAHPVRISYTRKPSNYQDEDSYTDMDDQLLIMLTLDTAIPFYGRPDGEVNNRHLNRHLGNIRAKQINGKRFFKGQSPAGRGTPGAADLIYAYPVVR